MTRGACGVLGQQIGDWWTGVFGVEGLFWVCEMNSLGGCVGGCVFV